MKARHRRRAHLAVAAVWLGPGLVASILWAHSVAWVVAMSWFACWYTAMAAWAAETPVEEENE